MTCESCSKKDVEDFVCACPVCGSPCRFMCPDRWKHEKDRVKKIFDSKYRKLPYEERLI